MGKRRFKPSRGGHAPGHLRELFVRLVDCEIEGDDDMPEIDGRKRTVDWLYGQLWNCTDTIPGDCCSLLEMPAGSTYAQAVRRLKAGDLS